MKSEIRIFLRIFVLFILLSLKFHNVSLSQESIEISYNYGSVLVHTPKIEPISSNPVIGFSLFYTFKNSYGEQWKRYFNYPNYGVSYSYKNYHYPDVLGASHSFSSFLQIPFLRNREYFDIGIKGLAGAAYFTKKYDPETNPLNNAISTRINITAELRLYSRLRFDPLYFEYSYGLSHASNGLVKSPNLGINVLNSNFNLGVELEGQLKREELPTDENPEFIRNEFWAFASVGVKEIEYVSDKYIFSGISLNYSKQVWAINKMGLGVDFSRDPSLTTFAVYRYGYSGDRDLSFRAGINIHNEFMMGRTGLYTAYGIYLGSDEFYSSKKYYKAGFKFYFENMFGLVLIRAIPLFRAQALEFGMGFRITDKKQRDNR